MSPPPTDPKVLAALKERIQTGQMALPMDEYIECVLYHPQQGYYMRDADRVGYRSNTDFYTASSMGELFTSLIIAAVQDLLGEDLSPYTFVELGPESEDGILGHTDSHPFHDHLLVRPGEPANIPDNAIVFSNELFDAQPFKRYIKTASGWQEVGISISGDDLKYCIIEPTQLPETLPESAPEGYRIDWPLHAHKLLEQICKQDWRGLFLAFDYGLDRSIIFTQRPEGTGRTYFKHQLGSNLLANPGFTDITCHLIWDELEERLQSSGFGQVELMRQESFFMQHSQLYIKKLMESSPAGFSKDKQTLMELLHPGNMGHRFQVLHATR